MGKTTFAMNLVESVLTTAYLLGLNGDASNSIAMRLISAMEVHQGSSYVQVIDADEWTKVTGTIFTITRKILMIPLPLPPTELRARARRIAKMHDGKSAVSWSTTYS